MSKSVKIGDIASLKTGPFGTQFSAKEYTSSGIPVINVKNIGYGQINEEELEFVNEQTRDRLSEHILRTGDIVFGRKGSVDRHAYVSEKYDGWVQGSDCIRLRFPEGINTRYISHFLKLDHIKRQINCASVGSTMASLNTDILRSIEVLLPSIEIQTDIEKVLSTIEEKIEVNIAICAELESMARTIYDYWFTQFDFPDADGKPYRSSGGKMVWNEQLKRKIPQGWTSDVIGNILAKVPNTVRIQTGDYLSKGNIPIIDQSTDFIAGYTNDPSSMLSSPTGYVVFGDHTRIVKYARFPFARGADGTQILKSKNSRVPDELLYQIVRSVDLSNYGYARHFKFLKDTPTIIPTESVAKEFARIVTPIYDKHAHLIFENIELTKLRNWLLPMLMNGQATVE